MAQVFLDCDGVLADFDKAASAVFGMPPRQFKHRFGLAVFWKKLAATPDFFARLDLLPDAMELYLPIRQLAPVVLTGLPRGHWAEPQKRRWAEEHFPGVPVITTTAALKYEYCHRGDALIDDREKYRHLWEGVGGISIHLTNARTSLEQLLENGFDVRLEPAVSEP